MLLHNEGIIVSEKVVRRIMRQEQLIVKQKRTKLLIFYIAIGVFVIIMTIYEIWRIITWSPSTQKNVKSVEEQRLCKSSKEDSTVN